MATHTLPAGAAAHITGAFAEPPALAARPPIFHRLYNAMIEAQMRRAEREVDLRLGLGALAQASRGERPKER